MQGAHGSETVAKVKRGRFAFLLHRRVDEPSLLEDGRPNGLILGQIPILPMKLELLPLHPRGQIGSGTFKKQVTNLLRTQQEGPSRLVPHAPVLAHVKLDIKVHAVEWHVAFDELNVFFSHVLDEGLMVHDGADSPDDFPLVCRVRDVTDLDLHDEVGKGRERKKKCGRRSL